MDTMSEGLQVVSVNADMEQSGFVAGAIESTENKTGMIPYQGASLLVLTPDENKTLDEPFNPKDIQIRPDGIVYLEQVFYRERLNKAFGRGAWVIVPVREWAESQSFYFLGELYVRGHFVSRACGCHTKRENNAMQTWADCYESAKSDCMTRCCKDLGIAKELWSREYDQDWIEKNAVKIWNEKTNNFNWRKKNSPPFWWESKQGNVESRQGDNDTNTPNSGADSSNERPKCPTCGVNAIIKGKEEYGGGWLCFKKKGGCGDKFTETQWNEWINRKIQPTKETPKAIKVHQSDWFKTADTIAHKLETRIGKDWLQIIGDLGFENLEQVTASDQDKVMRALTFKLNGLLEAEKVKPSQITTRPNTGNGIPD
jgi:hypothetical protein